MLPVLVAPSVRPVLAVVVAPNVRPVPVVVAPNVSPEPVVVAPNVRPVLPEVVAPSLRPVEAVVVAPRPEPKDKPLTVVAAARPKTKTNIVIMHISFTLARTSIRSIVHFNMHYTVTQYRQTCSKDHLYIKTTCLKRSILQVPRVILSMLLNSHIRPPLYKGPYFVGP